MSDRDRPGLTLSRSGSVAELPADQWDALTDGGNPFVSHAFLSLLEESESVGGRSGWIPSPFVLLGDDGRIEAALPAYLKAHSQGEYVFDHSWADAWARAGGHYYPKLQIAVPFTPANGPRLLTRRAELELPLLRVAERFCEGNDLSSAHATFIEPPQIASFERAGWQLRSDIQFHWENRGYASFEAFLGELSSRKRKAIRKERDAAREGLEFLDLTGRDLRSEHWDAFWRFYQDTGARKWGRPYLTRAAFDLIGERMADKVLLFLACRGGVPIAGALNFLGRDTLFGRYWGCTEDRPFLHFELCYYRAMEAAIDRGLKRVEAGAQGGHKLSRGYEPVQTWSAHWIADPGFRDAVAAFLSRERHGVAADQVWLNRQTPFRRPTS